MHFRKRTDVTVPDGDSGVRHAATRSGSYAGRACNYSHRVRAREWNAAPRDGIPTCLWCVTILGKRT